MEETIVYKKVESEEGAYQDKDGKRYDILTCHHTESREQVQVSTTTEEIDGEIVEVPVYESQVVINKGWDNFENLEEAEKKYKLIKLKNENIDENL